MHKELKKLNNAIISANFTSKLGMIVEYPELEGTPKDHQVQILMPHRTTQNNATVRCYCVNSQPRQGCISRESSLRKSFGKRKARLCFIIQLFPDTILLRARRRSDGTSYHFC